MHSPTLDEFLKLAAPGNLIPVTGPRLRESFFWRILFPC
jgi:hypothetical protein